MPPTRQQRRQLERAESRNGSISVPDLGRQKLPQFAASIDEVEMVGDFLLIEMHLPGQSAGGIQLPEGYSEGEKKGTVRKAGPGQLRDDGTRSPMECKENDLVFLNLSRHALQYNIGGKDYLVTPDSSVIMKVAKKSEVVAASGAA